MFKLAHKVPVINLGFKKVEFDDWRDFFEALHNWGYNTDFTYRSSVAENLDEYVANLLLSYFLDVNMPLDYTGTQEFAEDFDEKEMMQMFQVLKRFGVEKMFTVGFIKKLTEQKV